MFGKRAGLERKRERVGRVIRNGGGMLLLLLRLLSWRRRSGGTHYAQLYLISPEIYQNNMYVWRESGDSFVSIH